MAIKYSLLVPSRKRPFGIRRLMDSLFHTTRVKNEVEIIFVIDNDDPESKEAIEGIIQMNTYPGFVIKCLTRERSEFLNRDYYNFAASYAQGEFYWAIGDDVVFLVERWDLRIYGYISEYLQNKPDRIVCVGIKDTTPKPKPSLPQFPCFPLITKEAYIATGYLLRPNIPTWGADYLIYLLYNRANRYISIEDEYYLHHIGIHTKTGPKDETAQNIENIFNRLKMADEHNIDRTAELLIPEEANKLRGYIVQHGGTL